MDLFAFLRPKPQPESNQELVTFLTNALAEETERYEKLMLKLIDSKLETQALKTELEALKAPIEQQAVALQKLVCEPVKPQPKKDAIVRHVPKDIDSVRPAAKEKAEFEKQRGCLRKYRYNTPPQDLKRGLRSYWCRFCDGYHITSKPL